MKVILTGSTGFIGSEVLSRAIDHPFITSIICITRRALPESIFSNPKVKVIILKDFTSYPPEVISQLSGAEACIWALGVPSTSSQKIEVEYTLAAASAFSQHLAPELRSKDKKFRFIYLSGMLANRDASKKLWFLQEKRTMKGTTENGLLAIEQKEGNNMDIIIARPGGVLAKETRVPDILVGLTKSIKVDELAAFLVMAASVTKEGERTWENDAVREAGKMALISGRVQ
ncbi:hypothetical protein BKA65DRAFT_514095 [Rhexocercosporidium sp. MPI-PUGE-AT-0058]|nr:hypothetical protein BKA65DRAFT_514095 [Rhexocercosporidium sp. MPI-PUGE-AT-0058]